MSTSGRSSQMRVSFAKNIHSYQSDSENISSVGDHVHKEAMMEYCKTNLSSTGPLRFDIYYVF